MSLWIIIRGEGGRATPGCTVKVGTLIQTTGKQTLSTDKTHGTVHSQNKHPSHLLVPSVCPPSLILSRSCGGGRGTMTGSGSGASAKLWCFLLCFLCFLCFRLWTLCKLELPSPAEDGWEENTDTHSKNVWTAKLWLLWNQTDHCHFLQIHLCCWIIFIWSNNISPIIFLRFVFTRLLIWYFCERVLLFYFSEIQYLQQNQQLSSSLIMPLYK